MLELQWKGKKKIALFFFFKSRALFTRPTSTKKDKYNFKTGSTILFIHLKIILL